MHLLQPCLIVSFATLCFSHFHSDLVNAFKVFLPHLIVDPNASAPLNGDAAALTMRDRAACESKVVILVKFLLLCLGN